MDDQDFEDRLLGMVNEAAELRFGLAYPAVLESSDVMKFLIEELRPRLDRADGLMNEAIVLQSRTHRALSAARAEADESWDEAIASIGNAPGKRRNEYEGAKERYSEANLRTLAKRRTVNSWEQANETAVSALSVIRNCRFGLDAVRSDFVAILRALVFESSLDR